MSSLWQICVIKPPSELFRSSPNSNHKFITAMELVLCIFFFLFVVRWSLELYSMIGILLDMIVCLFAVCLRIEESLEKLYEALSRKLNLVGIRDWNKLVSPGLKLQDGTEEQKQTTMEINPDNPGKRAESRFKPPVADTLNSGGSHRISFDQEVHLQEAPLPVTDSRYEAPSDTSSWKFFIIDEFWDLCFSKDEEAAAAMKSSSDQLQFCDVQDWLGYDLPSEVRFQPPVADNGSQRISVDQEIHLQEAPLPSVPALRYEAPSVSMRKETERKQKQKRTLSWQRASSWKLFIKDKLQDLPFSEEEEEAMKSSCESYVGKQNVVKSPKSPKRLRLFKSCFCF